MHDVPCRLAGSGALPLYRDDKNAQRIEGRQRSTSVRATRTSAGPPIPRPGQRPVSYTTGDHEIVLSVRTPLRLHASGRNCTLFVVMVSDAVVSFGPGQGSV